MEAACRGGGGGNDIGHINELTQQYWAGYTVLSVTSHSSQLSLVPRMRRKWVLAKDQ